mmetsp:Transcript_7867/g.20962  ORF Transcript_7867/g.20962 Transcript_7867/m.20962 type:complete len:215 (-) Transcript_7867:31-675(-)
MRRALLHFQRYKSVPIRVLAGPDRREVAPAEFFDHSVSSVKHVADPHGMVAARPIALRALAIQFADVAPGRRRRRRRRVVIIIGVVEVVPTINVVLGRVGDGLGRLLRLLARGRLGGRGLSVFAAAAFPRHRPARCYDELSCGVRCVCAAAVLLRRGVGSARPHSRVSRPRASLARSLTARIYALGRRGTGSVGGPAACPSSLCLLFPSAMMPG